MYSSLMGFITIEPSSHKIQILSQNLSYVTGIQGQTLKCLFFLSFCFWGLLRLEDPVCALSINQSIRDSLYSAKINQSCYKSLLILLLFLPPGCVSDGNQ